MPKIPKLIVDTSAVNALEKDPEKNTIIEGLRLAYHVGITETVLSEIAADPDEPRRKAHLDLLKRFLGFGKCVMPFHWIIEAHAKAYLANPNAYEWQKLDVRFREGEEEIARQKFIHTVSEETLAHNRKAEQEYRGLFTRARTHFDEIFASGKERPALEEVANVLVAPGGAHFEIAADLFERATGKRPSNDEIKDFVERCPPFKALIMALCFSQYDLCIRGDNVQSLGKAGRQDMFSAVFLPYCKIFVTRDEGQHKALSEVAKMTGLETTILMYDDFKNRLYGLG
jgi:hypothetical protein